MSAPSVQGMRPSSHRTRTVPGATRPDEPARGRCAGRRSPRPGRRSRHTLRRPGARPPEQVGPASVHESRGSRSVRWEDPRRSDLLDQAVDRQPRSDRLTDAVAGDEHVLAGCHLDPDGDAASEQAGGATEVPGGPMDAFDTEERPEAEEDLPDQLLRFELVYPDGSTASSVDHLLATAAGSEPEEPALNPYSGTGDERVPGNGRCGCGLSPRRATGRWNWSSTGPRRASTGSRS